MAVKEQAHSSPRYPPGPRRIIPLSGLFAYRKGPLPFFQNLAQQYGDISYFRLGPQEAFFLNNPDYIREVLVTRHHSFHKGLALQRAKRLLGEGLLTIVGKTLFDADVASSAQEVGEAMTVVMDLFNTITIPFFELLQKLPLPQLRRFDVARARLDAIIYRLIEERRRGGVDRGDLLSMLLLAQDTEGDGGTMTDSQLRDELMTIFLAGHETTANALTWTWYLLSQNPVAEGRLHEEIDAVVKGRVPAFEDVAQLKYTEMVLAEAMRLYPPAWALGRLATEEFEIAGYVVPKKSLVLMSQYVMHRDPRYFIDPLRFDPERWTPEARETRPQFTYFPFGGGPRRCIGEGFAWMEGILLLATLARPWRMRLAPNHPVALKPVITLRPKYGMRMTITRRQTAGAVGRT